MKERIKQLRKALGMTQQKFADAIGVKQNTVAQYEIGRNKPIESVINLICKEYNVNEEWLRTGQGEMFIVPTTFSLDEYAKVNKLTNAEIAIVREFMELKPETRQAFYNIFTNAFSENSDTIPNTPQELEQLYPPIDNKNSNAV